MPGGAERKEHEIHDEEVWYYLLLIWWSDRSLRFSVGFAKMAPRFPFASRRDTLVSVVPL